MEKHQSQKIKEKIYDLMPITRYSEEFLQKFQDRGVLTQADTVRILSMLNADSSTQDLHHFFEFYEHASLEFYKELISSQMPNTFNLLLAALSETGQHEAYKILTNKEVPFPFSLLKEGRRFQQPPSAIAQMFASGKQKVLLLESSNIPMLLERIMETISRVKLMNWEDAATMDVLNVILIKEKEKMSLPEIASKLSMSQGLFVVLCEEGSIPSNFDLPGNGGGICVVSNRDTFRWRELSDTLKGKILNQLRSATGLDILTVRSFKFLEDEELIQLMKDSDSGDIHRRKVLFQLVDHCVRRKVEAFPFPPEVMYYLGCLGKSQVYGWSRKNVKVNCENLEPCLRTLVSKGLMTLSLNENPGDFNYRYVDNYVATYFLAFALTRIGEFRGTPAVEDELHRNVFTIVKIKPSNTHEFRNELLVYFIDAFLSSSNQFQIRYVSSCTEKNIHASLNGGFIQICKETCRSEMAWRDSNGRFLIHKPKSFLTWSPSTLIRLNHFGVKLDGKDDHGRNLLHYAIEAGKAMAYIKKLINCGASYTEKDNDGNSVLHTAATSGHIGAIKSFSKLLNVNEKNELGDTALHVVLEYGTKNKNKIVGILLKKGADVNGKGNRLCTPLHVAKFGRNREKIKPKTIKLLEKKGGKEEVFDEE